MSSSETKYYSILRPCAYPLDDRSDYPNASRGYYWQIEEHMRNLQHPDPTVVLNNKVLGVFLLNGYNTALQEIHATDFERSQLSDSTSSLAKEYKTTYQTFIDSLRNGENPYNNRECDLRFIRMLEPSAEILPAEKPGKSGPEGFFRIKIDISPFFGPENTVQASHGPDTAKTTYQAHGSSHNCQAETTAGALSCADRAPDEHGSNTATLMASHQGITSQGSSVPRTNTIVAPEADDRTDGDDSDFEIIHKDEAQEGVALPGAGNDQESFEVVEAIPNRGNASDRG